MANELLIGIDIVGLVISIAAVVVLKQHEKHVGPVVKKSFDFIIYGVILMASASVYTIAALYSGIAGVDSILSVQTVLMFVGFLFFIGAAYSLHAIGE